ncbi:MAG: diaminopimelate decarboxylase [Bacteroidales bacterium]
MKNNNISNYLRRIPTPYYYYNMDLLDRTLEALIQSASVYNYRLSYALKANNRKKLVQRIRSYGLGADCVSGGEVRLALDAGFSPERIFFAGVGKTDEEIRLGLHHRIFAFNVESVNELEVIRQIAEAEGLTAGIMLRINPHLSASTHEKISTGEKTHKFGIIEKDIPEAISRIKNSNVLNFKGIHFHIGSQIQDMQVFKTLALQCNSLQKLFSQHQLPVSHLNLGGGLGINYDDPHRNPVPDFASYFKTFADHLDVFPGQQVHFEPGRSVIGQSGTLITKVLYIKETGVSRFAIVDASMTDLIRPALYSATHYIARLCCQQPPETTYDIVGPVCESSDLFARQVPLPWLQRGDYLAIHSAGAYGQVMASRYNLRPAAKAVYSPKTLRYIPPEIVK